MNILADENLESEIVTALRLAGHSVSDIKEIRPGVDDPEVLSIANRTDAILLTNDKDFGELVYRDRLFSTGIILLRFGKLEIAERADLPIAALEEHSSKLVGAFTVISPTGVRIRH